MPLTQADDDDVGIGSPSARGRHRDLWEQVRAKVVGLVRFEAAAGFEVESAYDEPMPLCVLPYESRLELLPLLPPTLRHRKWTLLFSSAEHGVSIKTVLRRCADRGPTLVLVRDKRRHVFGAFAAEAWRRDPEPHFYGTGEAFLFSTWQPDGECGETFRSWAWTGANRYCQLASIDFLAFGSGGADGHFGLWLGRSLGTGSTGRCATFENKPLTEHSVEGGLDAPHRGDSAFEVQELQVWGFARS